MDSCRRMAGVNMRVLVQGQDFNWVRKLRQICREKQIDIAEGESPGILADLLVSDSAQNRGKGILREIPFLIVSGKEDEETILQAFKQGAEDYLISPVSPSIAAARIEGILKRYGWGKSHVSYTPNEYRLMSFMMRHPYHVLSREQILAHIWDSRGRYVDEGTVAVNIRRLRAKIEDDPKNPQRIQTVHGIGYIWKDVQS